MSEAAETKRPQWIRQAVDFGALIAFMAAYFITRDMIKATWVLVIASAIALTVGFIVERRLAPMPLITGGFALIFGALTILTDDDLFVKLKLTVQNGLLAAVLLGSIPLNKSPFKALLGSAIKVTDAAWRTLTLRYGLYFAAVCMMNEIIWRTQSDDTWVAFRGGLWIASAAFGVWQVFFIMKHLIKDDDPAPVSPDPGL